MNTIKVRNIEIGAGAPKIIVPIVGVTKEEIIAEVNTAIDFANSKKFFIPCMTSGINDSNFPGVYDIVTRIIDERSKSDF